MSGTKEKYVDSPQNMTDSYKLKIYKLKMKLKRQKIKKAQLRKAYKKQMLKKKEDQWNEKNMDLPEFALKYRRAVLKFQTL